MNNEQIYETILSRIETELKKFGFKRSGKGKLYYRYFADKKVGCGIEMQKSMFNYPGYISFTFNMSCIAMYNIYNYWGDKLNLSILRKSVNCIDGDRMGTICRGYDYWWVITDEIMNAVTPNEYYDRYLASDIIKSANYLIDLAKEKSKCYEKVGDSEV